MEQWLLEPAYWNWLILCGIFLIIEIFTVTFFFLTWGSAAAVMAILLFVLPSLSLSVQWIIFSALSLLSIACWWLLAHHWQRNPNDEASQLNNRGCALIGRVLTLTTPIEHHTGKMQIDDAVWHIRCTEDLPVGIDIRVVGLDGLTLLVSRVD